jgi:hypothetical protein
MAFSYEDIGPNYSTYGNSGGIYYTDNPSGDKQREALLDAGENPSNYTWSWSDEKNAWVATPSGGVESVIEGLSEDYSSLTPSLQQYTGDTTVSLTSEQQNTIDLANSLVTGSYGNYRQLLSGEPNYGQLDLGVIQQGRTNLREQVLPQLSEIYSGGAYGGDYNTGARQDAQAQAVYSNFENENTLRYQAQQQATANSLSALGLLPSLMGIENVELQNEIANLERTINVHYKNQGLTAQDIQFDLQAQQMAISQGLGEAQVDLQSQQLALMERQYEDQLQAQEDANNAGLLGGLGSLLGAGAGYLLAPETGGMSIPLSMMVGSQAGSTLGLYAGGANTAGYQTLNSGIQNIGSYYMMQNLLNNNGLGANNYMIYDENYGGSYPSNSVLNTNRSLFGR